MTADQDAGEARTPNARAVLRRAMGTRDGFRFLMRGLRPRLVSMPPAAGITFFSYEWAKGLLMGRE